MRERGAAPKTLPGLERQRGVEGWRERRRGGASGERAGSACGRRENGTDADGARRREKFQKRKEERKARHSITVFTDGNVTGTDGRERERERESVTVHAEREREEEETRSAL